MNLNSTLTVKVEIRQLPHFTEGWREGLHSFRAEFVAYGVCMFNYTHTVRYDTYCTPCLTGTGTNIDAGLWKYSFSLRSGQLHDH